MGHQSAEPHKRDLHRLAFAGVLVICAIGSLAMLYTGLRGHPLQQLPHAPPDGFRQMGQALVGTVATDDGKRLTLVLDARTGAVIGSRLDPDTGNGDLADMPLPPQTRP